MQTRISALSVRFLCTTSYTHLGRRASGRGPACRAVHLANCTAVYAQQIISLSPPANLPADSGKSEYCRSYEHLSKLRTEATNIPE
jgi:hypothetical protein